MVHILDTQCTDGDCDDILTKNQLYSIRHEFRIVYMNFFCLYHRKNIYVRLHKRKNMEKKYIFSHIMNRDITTCIIRKINVNAIIDYSYLFVERYLVLDWLHVYRNRFVRLTHNWRQLSYILFKKIMNNWRRLKVRISFGSSMALLFKDTNWP